MSRTLVMASSFPLEYRYRAVERERVQQGVAIGVYFNLGQTSCG
jgi:hypothetical protein